MNFETLFTDDVYRELSFIDCKAILKTVDLELFSIENSTEISYYNEVIRNAAEPKPGEVQWIHFADHAFSNEEIKIPSSFALARNFSKMYPALCKDILENINDNLNISLNAKTSAITLARSTRSIPRHRDVARRGAINCFLQNAELASTHFYHEMNDINPFHSVQTKDYKSYLINSEIPHEINHHGPQGLRYFLTINIPYTT